jgi:hypothetical protein
MDKNEEEIKKEKEEIHEERKKFKKIQEEFNEKQKKSDENISKFNKNKEKEILIFKNDSEKKDIIETSANIYFDILTKFTEFTKEDIKKILIEYESKIMNGENFDLINLFSNKIEKNEYILLMTSLILLEKFFLKIELLSIYFLQDLDEEKKDLKKINFSKLGKDQTETILKDIKNDFPKFVVKAFTEKKNSPDYAFYDLNENTININKNVNLFLTQFLKGKENMETEDFINYSFILFAILIHEISHYKRGKINKKKVQKIFLMRVSQETLPKNHYLED